jgi:hypothetical protein
VFEAQVVNEPPDSVGRRQVLAGQIVQRFTSIGVSEAESGQHCAFVGVHLVRLRFPG